MPNGDLFDCSLKLYVFSDKLASCIELLFATLVKMVVTRFMTFTMTVMTDDSDHNGSNIFPYVTLSMSYC